MVADGKSDTRRDDDECGLEELFVSYVDRLNRGEELNPQEILTKLTANHLFSDASETQLASFADLAVQQQLSKGTVLYARGEESNQTFCFVLTGCLHVIGKDNKLKAIRQAGDVLGEIALFIPQQQRTHTVFAVEPSEILVWEIIPTQFASQANYIRNFRSLRH